MRSLEVSLNGKVLYVAGADNLGTLRAGVDWVRIAQNEGATYEHLWVEARRYSGKPLRDEYWQNYPLKAGDEVTIRVLDAASSDQPLPGLPDFPYSET